MTTCPHCGLANTDSARACKRCGMVLRPGASPRPRVSVRVVRADGGPEASAVMSGDSLTCGQKGNLALSDDPFLAPLQVRFTFSGQALMVEDVGSGNGTFLRLRGEVELTSGSELRLGRQRLRLEAILPPKPFSEGNLAWGSPEGDAAFRLVQILEGGVLGVAHLIRPGVCLLGRDTGDLVFPQDGFISGRHAALELRQGRAFLKDLGSSNGTFVRLSVATPVENGDQFLVGRELIRVEVSPAAQ